MNMPAVFGPVNPFVVRIRPRFLLNEKWKDMKAGPGVDAVRSGGLNGEMEGEAMEWKPSGANAIAVAPRSMSLVFCGGIFGWQICVCVWYGTVSGGLLIFPLLLGIH